MRYLLTILLLSAVVFAQPRLDSLLSSYKNLPDTTKAAKLAELCWEMRSIHPQHSIMYGKVALAILESTHNTTSPLKGEILNYIGVIYTNLGKLDSAFSFIQRALAYSRANNDSNQIGYGLDNLGDYYMKNALYSTALEKFMESLSYFEKMSNKRGMAYAYNDMGELFTRQKDFDKALQYFQISASYRRELKDIRGLAKSYINIANVYQSQGKYELAIETYNQGFTASEESGYIKGKSWVYAGLAEVYYKQFKYQNALENRYRALDIDTTIGNKYGELINLNAIGQIFIKTGDLNRAKQFLLHAKVDAQATGHLDQLMQAYDLLTEWAVTNGSFKDAYQYLKDFQQIKESIYSQENLNKIADLQTAFVIEKKDKEAEILKRDIAYEKNTRNYALLIVLLLVGLGFLFVSKYRTEKKANELLTELNSNKDTFFSILAHDLKNPFGAVASMSDLLRMDYDELTDSERKEMIASISNASGNVQKLLMDLLTWARTQKGEIKVNKTDLEIGNILSGIINSYKLLADGKNIALSSMVSVPIKMKGDKFIIETIVANLVNNAIKFSYPEKPIVVSAKVEEKKLKISVQDFGKGMTNEIKDMIFKMDSKISTLGTNNERGTGLGLKICKQFAELHGGELSVTSEVGKGSTFYLSLPVE